MKDDHEHRKLVDHIHLNFPDDVEMGWLETDRGKVDLNPPLSLKAGETYRLELFNDSTISLWQLVADGTKGEVH